MPASDWSELCVQTIIWQPLASRDATGAPVYGTAVTFAPPTGGRRVFKSLRRQSIGIPPALTPIGTAVDFIQVSVIWILATPDVKLEDRVYVQGDSAPYPVVIGVDRYPDENGDLFVKVTMGSSVGS